MKKNGDFLDGEETATLDAQVEKNRLVNGAGGIQDSRRLLKSVALFGALLITIVFIWLNYFSPNLSGLLRWAQGQRIAALESRTMEPPWYLRMGLATGTVRVVRTSDDAIVLLAKTKIGWKQNYDGFVVSDRPLSADEFFVDAYGRQCIGIAGLDADYPVVREEVNTSVHSVFFDLN